MKCNKSRRAYRKTRITSTPELEAPPKYKPQHRQRHMNTSTPVIQAHVFVLRGCLYYEVKKTRAVQSALISCCVLCHVNYGIYSKFEVSSFRLFFLLPHHAPQASEGVQFEDEVGDCCV